MNRLMICGLLFVTVGANAAPVYLKCVTQSTKPDTKPTHYQLTLDEQASTVTVLDDGFTQNKLMTINASFTQDAVTYKLDVLEFAGISLVYRVDRVNLKFTESSYSADPDKPSNVNEGTCEISKPIKRAF